MPFQYQPAATQPDPYRGDIQGTGTLAGFSIVAQALEGLRGSLQRRRQQDFLAGVGQQVQQAMKTEEVAPYKLMPEWAFLDDKEITEGGEGEGATPTVIQEDGMKRFWRVMKSAGVSPTQGEAYRRWLMTPRPRQVLDPTAMHSILAEGSRAGVDPSELGAVMSMYGASGSVGMDDLREDLRKEAEQIGLHKIDWDTPHPLSLEIQADPANARGAIMNFMERRFGLTGARAEAALPGVTQILMQGYSMGETNEALSSYMPSVIQQTAVVEPFAGAPAGAFRNFENPESVEKLVDILGSIPELGDVQAITSTLQMNPNIPLRVDKQGDNLVWSTVPGYEAGQRVVEGLNSAMEAMGPERRAVLEGNLLHGADPVTTRLPGGVPTGGRGVREAAPGGAVAPSGAPAADEGITRFGDGGAAAVTDDFRRRTQEARERSRDRALDPATRGLDRETRRRLEGRSAEEKRAAVRDRAAQWGAWVAPGTPTAAELRAESQRATDAARREEEGRAFLRGEAPEPTPTQKRRKELWDAHMEREFRLRKYTPFQRWWQKHFSSDPSDKPLLLSPEDYQILMHPEIERKRLEEERKRREGLDFILGRE